MKIGLASYECRMNDIGFNLKQIEKAIVESKDADLVCFGEAFLQGFAAVTSDYEMDIKMAAEQDSARGKDPGAVVAIPQSRYGRVY